MIKEGFVLANRYVLQALIGKGGMANVYRALDRRINRIVAIKVLKDDLAIDPVSLTRFQKEVQAAGALNHSTIVAVYDSGEETIHTNDKSLIIPYIVMENVEGKTLRQILQQDGTIPVGEALRIISGVLDALEYSHSHGLIHRDIKPGNIMVTGEGKIKVMDFGIARAIADSQNSMTSAQVVMGTAQYLSPEQAKGHLVDARSDIYSTGILLYELLSGKPPFTGDSALAVAYQHVKEKSTPLTQLNYNIPTSVSKAVQKAIEKDPKNRYQSAGEFHHELTAIRRQNNYLVDAAATQVIPRVKDTRKIQLTRPIHTEKKTNPWIWTLILSSAIGVVVGIVWLASSLFSPTGINKITVPNLEGLTVSQAIDQLQQIELILGNETPQTSLKPIDTILSQNPFPGTSLDPGQPVDITISAGPSKTTVPALIGLQSLESARQKLAEADLTLGPIKYIASDKPSNYIIESDPIEGVELPVGSEVSIFVSDGFVSIPRLVNLSANQASDQLQELGLFTTTTKTYDPSKADNIVISQIPSPGTKVSTGTLINIIVNDHTLAPKTEKSKETPTTKPDPVYEKPDTSTDTSSNSSDDTFTTLFPDGVEEQ